MTAPDLRHVGAGDRLTAGSPEFLEDLRREFSQRHYFRVRGFFDRRVLDAIGPRVKEAEFAVRSNEDVGSEWVMKRDSLLATLNWLMNGPELIRVVRFITEAEVGYFDGRIYRLEPAPDQSFDWHTDRNEEARRVGISVNLSEREYSGGVLQIRQRSAPEAIASVPNVGRGDAVLFRVADQLEHRVTPVEGRVPRLAFTGWFRDGPSYHSLLVQGTEATTSGGG